jgi:hypothetical protein
MRASVAMTIWAYAYAKPRRSASTLEAETAPPSGRHLSERESLALLVAQIALLHAQKRAGEPASVFGELF